MSRIALVLGPSTGGIGTHVAGLAKRASDEGHEVWIAGPAETIKRFGLDKPRWGNVDLSEAKGIPQLRKVIDACDLVHAHGLRAGSWAGIASPWRTPLIVTWHNQRRSGDPKSRMDRAAERYVARRADLSLCVSPDLVETVKAHGGRPVWSPLGPPLLGRPRRSREKVRAALKVGPSTKLILSVARLAEQKGLDVLIEALESFPIDSTLVVAGSGPLEASLKDQAARARIDVRWLGRRDDLPDLLLAADVLAMPSRWEGSPFAMHEAFQAGLPVVASAVGGIPPLASSAASLVAPDDPAALRRALSDVLGNAELSALLSEGGVAALNAWPDEQRACDLVLARYDLMMGRRR